MSSFWATWGTLGAFGRKAVWSEGGVEYKIDPAVAARIDALDDYCAMRMARAMAGKARTLAPVKSGYMKDHIKVRVGRSRFDRNAKIYRVGTRTQAKLKDLKGFNKRGYGAPVEFGHYQRRTRQGRAIRWVAPKPFMRPARLWIAQNLDMLLRSALG